MSQVLFSSEVLEPSSSNRSGPGLEEYQNAKDFCCICLTRRLCCGLVVVETPCKHSFHRECIIPWIVDHSKHSCPLCTEKLLEKDLKIRNLRIVIDSDSDDNNGSLDIDGITNGQKNDYKMRNDGNKNDDISHSNNEALGSVSI